MWLYLLKGYLILTIFFISYRLLLSKTHYFTFNRYFLLAGVILSVAYPLFTFSISRATVSSYTLLQPLLLEGEVLQINRFGEADSPLLPIIKSSLKYLYLSISIFLILLRVFEIKKLVHYVGHLKQKGEKIGRNIYSLAENQQAFSFFRQVFLPHSLTQNTIAKATILKHEMVHVKQFHSIDIVIYNLVSCIFFLHPFRLKLRKAIQENHEFIADEAVVKTIDQSSYIKTMIDCTLMQIKQSTLVNHFAKPQIFGRISMLKSKHKQHHLISVCTAFLLSMLTLSLFNCELKEINPLNNDENIIFTVTEQQPMPQGGIDVLYNNIGNYISQHIPSSNKIEGNCYVEFVIEKDGRPSNIKIVKGIDDALDKIAIEAIEESGLWIPATHKNQKVRSKRVIPIRFSL